MKNLKLLVICNDNEWKSWDKKIADLRSFFGYKVNLQIDIRRSDFYYTEIPWIPDSNGANYFRIEDNWYNQNISSKAKNFDIVLFVLPLWQWRKPNDGWGYRTDRSEGPIELHIAASETAIDEMPNGDGTYEKIDMFLNRARHEILHALFMISGQNDTTHKYCYAKPTAPEKALGDVVFPENQTEKLNALKAVLQGLLQMIQFLMQKRLVMPIKGYSITQKFMEPDPVSYPTTGVHPGVDYGTQGAKNVPLFFVGDGEVIERGFHGAFGNYFFLYVPAVDRTFAYFHLAGVSPQLGTADRGIICGYTGDTGQAQGIHLHIECIHGRATSADRKRLFTSKEAVAKNADDADAFIRARLYQG